MREQLISSHLEQQKLAQKKHEHVSKRKMLLLLQMGNFLTQQVNK
jgi:hypothetical protein